MSGAAPLRLHSPPVMAARESTIIRDTSDTIDMPPLRASHSRPDSDLGVHSSNIKNDMGSQSSAFMLHNAAKMAHRRTQGDATPLRAASPTNVPSEQESAHSISDIAIDDALAADYSKEIEGHLSIEEVIDGLYDCDVDDKHDGDAHDKIQDTVLPRTEQPHAQHPLERNEDIDMVDDIDSVEYVEYEYEQTTTRRAQPPRDPPRGPSCTPAYLRLPRQDSAPSTIDKTPSEQRPHAKPGALTRPPTMRPRSILHPQARQAPPPSRPRTTRTERRASTSHPEPFVLTDSQPDNADHSSVHIHNLEVGGINIGRGTSMQIGVTHGRNARPVHNVGDHQSTTALPPAPRTPSPIHRASGRMRHSTWTTSCGRSLTRRATSSTPPTPPTPRTTTRRMSHYLNLHSS